MLVVAHADVAPDAEAVTHADAVARCRCRRPMSMSPPGAGKSGDDRSPVHDFRPSPMLMPSPGADAAPDAEAVAHADVSPVHDFRPSPILMPPPGAEAVARCRYCA